MKKGQFKVVEVSATEATVYEFGNKALEIFGYKALEFSGVGAFEKGLKFVEAYEAMVA